MCMTQKIELTNRSISRIFFKFAVRELAMQTFQLITVLMYKTAVYTLVNGVITHHKQQISKK